MTIYYLMVKTQIITGLKYLCQTKNKNPHTYLGSGKYWGSHLRKHGKDITTVIIRECSSKEELREWGIYYSILWNIVTDRDANGNKTWANLIPESGSGTCGPRTELTKQKLRESWNDPSVKIFRSLQIKKSLSKPDVKEKMREQQHRIKNDTSYQLKNKKAVKDSWNNPIIRLKRILAIRKNGNDIEFKKHMSSITAGSNNPAFDHTVYAWQHVSGIIENLTRFDLCKKYSLHKSAICCLVSGKRKTHKGWELLVSD